MTKRKSVEQDGNKRSSPSFRKVARSNRSGGYTALQSGAAHPSAKHGQGAPNTIDDDHQPCGPVETETPQIAKGKHLKIVEETGDIFAAPPNSVLIHACNCEGHWGAGIAKAFKEHYPKAYKIYHSHCLNSDPADLPGTAFLIPPQTDSKDEREAASGHSIGCLFTSRGKGRTKDSPAKILANTGPAVRDLMAAIAQRNAERDDETKVERMIMCRINSGLFKVPWNQTKAIVEVLEVAEALPLTVMEKS